MKPDATIQRLADGAPVRWIALGDSLTYGWMVKKGYLDFLAEMIQEKHPAARVDIYNRGIPGDTADGGLRRLRDHVLSMQPDIVSVQFALNDVFVGYEPDRFERNMTAIVRRLQEGISGDILLMTSVALADPDDNARAEIFYSVISDIAAREHLPCALVHAYWQQRIAAGCRWEDLLQSDGVHPTEQGYRLMAEAIMQVL